MGEAKRKAALGLRDGDPGMPRRQRGVGRRGLAKRLEAIRIFLPNKAHETLTKKQIDEAFAHVRSMRRWQDAEFQERLAKARAELARIYEAPGVVDSVEVKVIQDTTEKHDTVPCPPPEEHPAEGEADTIPNATAPTIVMTCHTDDGWLIATKDGAAQ